MDDHHQKPLYAAVLKLLRPLIRILIRNHVSFGTFSELAKWVFVDVATQEFDIPGRKQSTSRVSVITGLSRREVTRVKLLPAPGAAASTERHNRAVRVIAAWRREPDFLDASDNPAVLPIEGSGPSFSELVKRFSGNVPPRAVLDELARSGAVRQLEGDKVCLLQRAYIPRPLDPHKLNILGTDVGLLLQTIDHNLNPEGKAALFQRKVSYNNLPDEILPKFRAFYTKKAQALLESADCWLAQHDRDVTPASQGTGRNLAGFGIFFFENPYSDEES